jgi:hypothetical protein
MTATNPHMEAMTWATREAAAAVHGTTCGTVVNDLADGKQWAAQLAFGVSAAGHFGHRGCVNQPT